eukprot:Skav205831  [mRNA]  locus=scaffold160:154326:155579:- [translate_table: standard]
MAQSLSADRNALRKVANATISAVGKSQRWDWSLHLLSAMKFQSGLPEPDVISYSTVISVVGKASRWQVSLQLLAESEGIADLVCFNSAIAACGQSLQWQKASTLVSLMMERLVMPDAVSVSSMLTACGNAMRWQLALWHFHHFYTFSHDNSLEALASPQSSRDLAASSACSDHTSYQGRFHPSRFHDVLTLSAAINACEKGRQWQAALELLAGAMAGQISGTTLTSPRISLELSSIFPDSVSFNAAIVACEGCSQWDLALDLLSQMRTPPATSYATTIKAMSAARRWQHALALVNSLLGRGAPVDGFAWGSLLTALHVKPERLHDILGPLVNHLDLQCRRGLSLRKGAEVAELLCVAGWMEVLGINSSSAVGRFVARHRGRGTGRASMKRQESNLSDVESTGVRALLEGQRLGQAQR